MAAFQAGASSKAPNPWSRSSRFTALTFSKASSCDSLPEDKSSYTRLNLSVICIASRPAIGVLSELRCCVDRHSTADNFGDELAINSAVEGRMVLGDGGLQHAQIQLAHLHADIALSVTQIDVYLDRFR